MKILITIILFLLMISVGAMSLKALQRGYGIEVSVKHARALAEIDFLKAKKDIEFWERGLESLSGDKKSLEELILAEERASINLEFFNITL